MTHGEDVLNLFVQRGLAAQQAVNVEIARAEKLGSVNPTPLLCREHVRRYLLDSAKQLRPFNKFNRVSEETLIAANEVLRAWCVGHVKRLPSKGKTI